MLQIANEKEPPGALSLSVYRVRKQGAANGNYRMEQMVILSVFHVMLKSIPNSGKPSGISPGHLLSIIATDTIGIHISNGMPEVGISRQSRFDDAVMYPPAFSIRS